MRIAYFTHSLRSSWNHGNAHFQRGLLRALAKLGHDAVGCEMEGNWSYANLLADHGVEGAAAEAAGWAGLDLAIYRGPADVDRLVDRADVVIVHEWSEPWLVERLGSFRRRGAKFLLLFHDTHHRAVSDPDAIRRFDLSAFDGVLAFGEALSKVYRAWGWGERVFTWHEAADTDLFHPPVSEEDRQGLVWIGNFGDGERGRELESFLLGPAEQAGLPLDIFGVRYPPEALAMLERHGARYRGYLPNAEAPAVFGRRLATVHVPRRFYTEQLPGIPTIRVFEALACGIPLVCAPWRDSEELFRPGADYLVGSSGAAMTAHLRALAHDADLRNAVAASGLERIRSRHTCSHRAEEVLAIVERITAAPGLEAAS